jgi:primosomal protein N'
VRAIPTWRADESLFRLLISLREKTTKELVLQTRNETDDLLLYATRGAVDRFHDDEIALRKMLSYPPFSTFIFITWQGTKSVVEATEEIVKNLLTPFGIKGQFYTNPNSNSHKPLRHCLLRVKNLNENKPLIKALRTLPSHIAININPERIV